MLPEPESIETHSRQSCDCELQIVSEKYELQKSLDRARQIIHTVVTYLYLSDHWISTVGPKCLIKAATTKTELICSTISLKRNRERGSTRRCVSVLKTRRQEFVGTRDRDNVRNRYCPLS